MESLGLRTGLTLSPHISTVRDPVQIAGQPVSPRDFGTALDRLRVVIDENNLQSPSYFELILALAFTEFVRADVDVAIVETGIGGLLDATNFTDRSDKVCVIGSVGLDHTEILGETIEEIAAQKCGIIRSDNSVVALRQHPHVNETIANHATQRNAHLNWVDPEESHLPFVNMPHFQAVNIALARAALDTEGYSRSAIEM